MYFRKTYSFVLTGVLLAPAIAMADPQLVVQITCENASRQTAQGSGVLISGEGHVLTAKHVVPEGDTCWGRVGSVEAERFPLEPLAQSIKYDGMVLKLDAITPDFATYCPLSIDMRGRDIRVIAFHPKSVKGPSEAEGIVSSHELNDDGMFETSVPSIRGKSGGPAFLYGSTSLIGIVAGGEYNAAGEKIDMLTPADKLASIAPMILSEDCRSVVDGYTVEQHQEILDKRLSELRADLERATSAEKEVLRLQLDAVLRGKADLQASFEAREEELRKLSLQLAELNEGQVSGERLEAAQEALYRGETALAKEIFEEIRKADAAAIKRLAGAEYGLGIIARDEVKWAEAYTHFEKAARLDPTYDHLYSAREFAWRMGQYRKAVQWGEDLIQVAESEFGKDSTRYGTALNEHALSLEALGLYDQAEPLYREAMETTGAALGRDHPHYAIPLNNLALLLWATGRYAEAEPLFREALSISETTFGKDHPVYATSLNNLAALLEATGRYAEAEPLYREAMETRETALGKDHPDYAQSLNNLAELLRNTGRYEEAEPLYREALKIDEATIGKDHPNYAIQLNNLALLLETTGRYEEAEPLYREAMETTGSALGKDHPDYAISLNNLAGLLETTGRYEEAERLYREAMEITEAALGKDHPAYAIRLNNLANLLVVQNRFDEAEPLIAQAIDIRKAALGVGHPDYTLSVWSLAFFHWKQGDFEQAEPLFDKVVPAFEASLGPDHPRINNARRQYEDFLKEKADRSQ